MVPELRRAFNEAFTKEKYEAYVADLKRIFPGQLNVRIAETPLFVDRAFANKMLSACSDILDVVGTLEYHLASEAALPPQFRVPGEDAAPHCILFDFAVCRGADGGLEPQLIEMQAFPAIFCWEVLLVDTWEKHFSTPPGYSLYLGGYNRVTYIDMLRSLVVSDTPVENVVLLDILPQEQPTRFDFYATQQLLGIKVLGLAELIQEGRELYYQENGRKVRIHRIYNRVVFDELFQQSQPIREKGRIFQEDLDVTWVPHPNWYYRLSKFTLPFLHHPYVPHTEFLHQVRLPDDLENYVVKPLFSFGGHGVILDVKKEDIDRIEDPSNWIIQRKMHYAGAIETLDGPTKAEIRLFYFRDPETGEYRVAANHARLSKGKMMGVRYNREEPWTGASFCFFEQG
jgi:hypothetical protein